MTERLVVIGGDAAGMSAAAGARRRRGADELEIVAFERGRFTSFAACGVPYLVGDLVHDSDDLVARSPEEHRRMGIDARIRHEVVAIDTVAGTVTVRDLDAEAEIVESYDQLVIATGATPSRPPLPGIDADGVFGVQTLEDGIVLRREVDEQSPKRAVVVGAGYIGIEMAEALLRRGLEVTVLCAEPAPMSSLDPDMGELIAAALRGLGVDLHLGEAAVRFEVEDGRVRAAVTAESAYPADIFVLGIGARPNVTLAREAGIAIGPSGGIETDDHQRTSVPNVFAAGDCVETRHLVTGRPIAVALGTHANKQGRVVGINATGGDAVFPGVLGTAVSKVCDYEVARTGLTEEEADDSSFDAFAITIDATSRAQYYPGTQPIKVKLVTETGSGRLIGAQIVGREGAAKRIDVLAACIWNSMTVEEIISVDLGYAPPFSPVWDPVLAAARVAAARVEGATSGRTRAGPARP
jgi:NADPH-dependent 2,4-dienoyl-CoA reductase/sulfur reductase-like enzyme